MNAEMNVFIAWSVGYILLHNYGMREVLENHNTPIDSLINSVHLNQTMK